MNEITGMGTRLTEGEKRERLEEYCAALAAVRTARGIFALILALSLLTTVGAYCAARWGKALHEPSGETATTSAPAGEPSMADAAGESGEGSRPLHHLFRLGLPLAAFLGPVSCALLAATCLIGANVTLSGGLGGVRGMLGAFFWALALLVLLFPWSRWFGDVSGVPRIPGVYSGYEELRHLPGELGDMSRQVLHYLRFLGYPILALLMLLFANRHFKRGYRTAVRHL
jgi:hypothetical protein